MQKPGAKIKKNASKCSSVACVPHLVKNKKLFDPKAYFHCSSCNGFFHYHCINVVTDDEKLSLVNGLGSRKCTSCELGHPATLDDHIRILAGAKTSLAQVSDSEELEYCALNVERKEIEAQMKESKGFYRRKLENVLRNLGCDHRI